jgi:cysteinyl-tRNA synthetase
MKLVEFRLQMESYRREVDEEAMSLKDSYLALDRLHSLYQKFDAEERTMADQVLTEWVLSEDEKTRFDALALIDDFKIASAISALEKLAERLATSSAPGAPYELQKVRRIVGSLSPQTS